MMVVGSDMFAMFFFLSEYLQDVQGYSPLGAGFAFLPMPIAILVGTQLSSRLVGRFGSRPLLVIGPAISAMGLLLSRLSVGSSYPLHIGLPGAITTFGVGMSFVPITLSATNGVHRRDAGLASGLISTTRQIGGSLGLAALLTVSAARTHAALSQGARAAETPGYARAFAVSALLMLLAAAVALFVLPHAARPEAAHDTPLPAEGPAAILEPV